MRAKLKDEFNLPPCHIECTEENGGPIVYVMFDGKRIAKRYPGCDWISLDPQYSVSGCGPDGDYTSVIVRIRDGYTLRRRREQ